jgi:hypothetical protein
VVGDGVKIFPELIDHRLYDGNIEPLFVRMSDDDRYIHAFPFKNFFPPAQIASIKKAWSSGFVSKPNELAAHMYPTR